MPDNYILDNKIKSKSGRTKIEEETLKKDVYFSDGYFSPDQFISFTEQLHLVHSLNKNDLLEIGIGNGIVSDFLRKAGLNVTTFDINPKLNPDFVGSVTDLKNIFPHRKFDLILCAEVLEHMPFACFEKAINNIAETTSDYAILTLPRCQKIIYDIQFKVKIPKLPYIEKGIFFSIPGSTIIQEHHWEIDSSKETRLKAINLIIKKYFKIVDSNRFRFRPFHYYFILKK